ncbi:hypothetical protein KSP40_PGU014864 [Platanthera guangdongensis]|uniref:Uncharacterized protein n=1 Tax=Platanthera guangdongensis TaxID=2320717 RepID=A0ABR2MT26_9ASPA
MRRSLKFAGVIYPSGSMFRVSNSDPDAATTEERIDKLELGLSLGSRGGRILTAEDFRSPESMDFRSPEEPTESDEGGVAAREDEEVVVGVGECGEFNEYGFVVVSAGYDRSVRTWDCRSQSTEPIQIIDTFTDSVMSICLTKTEIIAGSVDGTVRTFDIRMGRELVDDLKQPVNCISLSNDATVFLLIA